MQYDDREHASELDMSRMIMQPPPPSIWVWWPVAALLLVALTTVPMILTLKETPVVAINTSMQAAENPQQQVSRASTTLLEVAKVAPFQNTAPISHQLRQPIRLTDRSADNHDLPGLTKRALAQFGYQADNGDLLQSLLVQTLAEGQTDAYVDAALNAALMRGEFAAPIALTTPFGELDTQRLLRAVLKEAQS